MLVDESTFAPLRVQFGNERQELYLLRRGPGISADEWIRFGREVPKDLFSNSWEVFAGELGNTSLYGDGPGGADNLEIVLLLSFIDFIPVLKPGINWLAIEHQAGGLACTHPAFVAIRLTPRPDVYERLREIARKRWPADCGDRYERGDQKEIAFLEKDLKHMGLSCQQVGRCLEESVYPIDASDAVLARIAVDPPALSTLIENYDAGFDHANLAVIILTENSD